MAFAPQPRRSARLLVIAALVGFGLVGCASTPENESRYPEQYGGSDRHDPFGRDAEAHNQGGLFGPDGITLFGGSDNNGGNSGSSNGGGIGVNSWLWRASLDTVSFMPLTTTDPFGGVIITDWYTTQESPTERFKVTVFILDRRLRADGVRVNVFRQEQNEFGQWADAEVDPEMPVRIENAILTRARQLRVSQFDS